jgi:AAA domain
MINGSIRAADVPREPVRWLWRERIPRGMISLVAGRPGEGKSLFTNLVGADVSRRSSRNLLNP